MRELLLLPVTLPLAAARGALTGIVEAVGAALEDATPAPPAPVTPLRPRPTPPLPPPPPAAPADEPPPAAAEVFGPPEPTRGEAARARATEP